MVLKEQLIDLTNKIRIQSKKLKNYNLMKWIMLVLSVIIFASAIVTLVFFINNQDNSLIILSLVLFIISLSIVGLASFVLYESKKIKDDIDALSLKITDLTTEIKKK